MYRKSIIPAFMQPPRELELLDLCDDALLDIFEYLDQKTSLNLMRTCLRFEALIGSSPELYRKLMLKLTSENLNKTRSSLWNVRRRFGTVSLHKLDLINRNNFSLVQHLFEVIGACVISLQIDGCKISKTTFHQMLQLVENVREIKLVSIEYKSKDNDANKSFLCSFKNLESLELNSFEDPEFVDQIFSQTFTLQHLSFGAFEGGWELISGILYRQQKLKSLEFNGSNMYCFDLEPEKWMLLNIQKLTIRQMKFPWKEDFENFTSFLQTQTNISELVLDRSLADCSHMMKLEDYHDIYTHLLNQKSLTTLDLEIFDKFEIFSTLEIDAPNVKSLTCRGSSFDVTNLAVFRYFSKVRKLTLNGLSKGINSLRHLKELTVYQMAEDKIQLITLKSLRKFSLKEVVGSEFNATVWTTFSKNNQNLEHLELPKMKFTFYQAKEFRGFIKVPSCLKVLKIQAICEERCVLEEFVKIADENCRKLEALKFELEGYYDSAINQHYPGLSFAVSKVCEEFYSYNLVCVEKQYN